MPKLASSSASVSATVRLRKDYMRIKKDPVPFITAEPNPSNILEWHYSVEGPSQSPYEGGVYHGKLVFPPDFPFKPPSIYMLTPNGRFKTNTKLCLSISDFHPDTWNPAWTVSTILTGLLSFMLETAPTYGSVETSDYEKKAFAKRSMAFNMKNKMYRELFPASVKAYNASRAESSSPNSGQDLNGELSEEGDAGQMAASGSSYMDTAFSNIMVLLGVAAIAFAVKLVITSVS